MKLTDEAKLKPAQWSASIKAKHAAHNATVTSRQVQRRLLFTQEFAHITHQYGGEERKRRRGIARTIARRAWHESRVAA